MREICQQKTKAEDTDVQVYFTEKNSKNQVIMCILYFAQSGKLCYNREASLVALKLIWVLIQGTGFYPTPKNKFQIFTNGKIMKKAHSKRIEQQSCFILHLLILPLSESFLVWRYKSD